MNIVGFATLKNSLLNKIQYMGDLNSLRTAIVHVLEFNPRGDILFIYGANMGMANKEHIQASFKASISINDIVTPSSDFLEQQVYIVSLMQELMQLPNVDEYNWTVEYLKFRKLIIAASLLKGSFTDEIIHISVKNRLSNL